MQPFEISATEAIALIASKQMSIEELMSSCISRIRELESHMRAWAYFDEAGALAAARSADDALELAQTHPPMQGIPVGVKDIFNTKDMPTQMGRVLWKGFTPGNDARVVDTLRRRGSIIMGKTVTAEFAVHAPGPTVNPFDPRRTPGTSSSGSAVAVATGMTPLALGSQTAGSTLRPASYCGIYGFKPSFGLIPRTGMLKSIDTLDHVAFLTRSVDDLSLIMDQTRVSGSNHPMVKERMENRKREIAHGYPWRVRLVRGPRWENAEGYAKQALEDFAVSLDGCPNIIVEELELPRVFKQVHEVHQSIYCRMLAYYFQEECKESSQISRVFMDMVEYGKKISQDVYLAGLEFQSGVANDLGQMFEEFDIILNLTTGGEALVGLDSRDRPDNCLIWTFCGFPSMTIPVFSGPNGLPFGAQLVAQKYHDHDLLQFAGLLEESGLAAQAPFPVLPDKFQNGLQASENLINGES